MKKEYFISGAKANVFSILLMIPIALISVLPYWFMWGTDHLIFLDSQNIITGCIFLVISFIVSIILHELIHGLSWCYFVESGWKRIKFGVMWSQLQPYCHCEEPLTARQYRIGLLMPTIVLGIIPTIIAWITGSGMLLFYGTIMTISGGGDLIIYGLMSKISGDVKVKDHPKEIGFTVEE